MPFSYLLLKHRSLVASLMVLSIVSSVSAAELSTRHYTIMMENGNKAGEQISTYGPNGSVKVHYIFKDNGRGPELEEEMHVGKDGTLVDYAVKGTSTFGAIVDEHFKRDSDHAEWHSTSEKGQKTVKGAAFYLPLNSSYEINSMTIQAAAKAPGHNLSILPSGNLNQKSLAEVKIKHNGKTQTVQLMVQTGVNFTPDFFWATKGPDPRLFAMIYPGFMYLIEEGWQENAKALEAAQRKAESQLLADMATQIQHPMPGLTVITNTRIFDSEKAALTEPSDVYVLRGKITAVLPTGSPIAGANHKIDAAGKVLLPGLFDMHAHLDRWDGPLHLAAGVTSVRDMGNSNHKIQEMIEETAKGQLLAPQITPAGFLEGQSPYSAQMGFVIKNLDEAKHAVDWYAEHGYPQLKIYNSFPHELVRDTVAYAHSRGMRVSGHVPAFMKSREVVEQGFDEIQHINQVLLNFLVTPQTDTRTLERFYLPAEKLASMDFDSKDVQDFLEFLKVHQTVIDSTLTTFQFIKQKDGDIAEPYAAVAEHMPTNVKRGFYVGSMKIPDDATLARYTKSYDKMTEFVGRMYKAGIPLVAGTDSYAGITLQSELVAYVKAGLTPSQALQVATLNGAKYTRTLSERGTITPGKLADLVLIDGDPTKQISDIRKVSLVITRGYALYPNEIDQKLGIAPFVDNSPHIQEILQ